MAVLEACDRSDQISSADFDSISFNARTPLVARLQQILCRSYCWSVGLSVCLSVGLSVTLSLEKKGRTCAALCHVTSHDITSTNNMIRHDVI